MDAKQRTYLPTFSLRTVLIVLAFLSLLFGWWADRSRLIERLYEPRFLISLNDYEPGTINRVRLQSQGLAVGRTYYPTVEIAPGSMGGEFLKNNPVRVEINRAELSVVDSGNFVTKVLYVPAHSLSGHFATMTATSLTPNRDPIAESIRKGKIVAVVRIGNKDVR